MDTRSRSAGGGGRVLRLRRGELVPVVDRFRALTLFRVAAAVLPVVATATGFVPASVSVGTIGLVGGAWLLVATLSGGALIDWRPFHPRWVFGMSLVVDAVHVAWLIAVTGGVLSPARHQVLVHLTVVTLLGGHRTGVRLAVWHSALLALLEVGDLVTTPAGTQPGAASDPRHVVVFVAALWLVTLATATASVVNEREVVRRRHDLEALARMATELEHTSDLRGTAAVLVSHVAQAFDLGRVLLVDVREGVPVPVAGRGHVDATSPGPSDGVPIDGILADAVTAGGTRRSEQLAPVGDAWLEARLPGATHLVVVPLVADGRSDMVLVSELGRRVRGRLEARVVATLERFASQGALALRNARLMSEMSALADTDGLTGVSNRRSFDREFERELRRAEREGGDLSLLLVDIDHFKQVNDVHGHQAGDEALRLVASSLQATVRTYDLVARFGGEEFAIVAPGLGRQHAHALGERLRLAVAGAGGPTPVTVSIGVATLPSPAATAATLVAAADDALYEAKRTGRNRVVRGTVGDDFPGLAAVVP